MIASAVLSPATMSADGILEECANPWALQLEVDILALKVLDDTAAMMDEIVNVDGRVVFSTL